MRLSHDSYTSAALSHARERALFLSLRLHVARLAVRCGPYVSGQTRPGSFVKVLLRIQH